MPGCPTLRMRPIACESHARLYFSWMGMTGGGSDQPSCPIFSSLLPPSFFLYFFSPPSTPFTKFRFSWDFFAPHPRPSDPHPLLIFHQNPPYPRPPISRAPLSSHTQLLIDLLVVSRYQKGVCPLKGTEVPCPCAFCDYTTGRQFTNVRTWYTPVVLLHEESATWKSSIKAKIW